MLAGRYQLVRFIACGGMAEVWEGRDALLARPVAIKMPLAQVARQEQAMNRFRREAVAAARLGHPNVVAVFDTGRDGADSFIVMELVDGQSLDRLLDTTGPLEVGRAVSIAAQVAGALDFACRSGIVHRDVKPANVLVTRDGVAKVTDFGIAKAVLDEAPAQTSATFGTARYIAPEQVEGRPTDGRTDVYALGAVLYEMLCGRPPFRADNDMAVALMHLREAPPPPSALRPGTPPWLEQIVMRALAKDPSGRYDSAGQLRSALLAPTRHLQPLPPPAHHAPPAAGDSSPEAGPPVASPEEAGPPEASPEEDRDLLPTGFTSLATGHAATVSFGPAAVTGEVVAGQPSAAGSTATAASTSTVTIPRPKRGPVGKPVNPPPPERGRTRTGAWLPPLAGRKGGGPAHPGRDRRSSGPARRRRTLPVVVAGVAVAALVVALVLALELGSSSRRPAATSHRGTAPGPTRPAAASSAVAVAAATSFDPYGNGTEDQGQVANLYDGNPSTSWHTDTYYSRDFGRLKPGVGFILRLARPAALRTLTLDTTTLGWKARVYLSGRSQSTLAAWGSPVARVTADQARVVVPLGGHSGAAVLVWFTGLGPARQAAIGEASLSS